MQDVVLRWGQSRVHDGVGKMDGGEMTNSEGVSI